MWMSNYLANLVDSILSATSFRPTGGDRKALMSAVHVGGGEVCPSQWVSTAVKQALVLR